MGNALTLPGNDRGGLNRKGLQFQVDELRILSPGVEEVVIRPEGRSHASLLVRGHRVMRFSRDHVANDPDTADTPDTSESRDIPIAFNKSASVQTLAAHAAFLLDSSPPAALSAVTLPLAITVDVEPGLKFTFRFALRGSVVPKTLTFVNVSSESELDSLLTTAFRSNPNIHLHPNVQIVEPELVKPLPQSSPLSSPSSPASDQTPPTLYEWAWIYSKPPSAPLSSKPFKNFWAFVNYDAATDSFQTLQYMSFYMSHPSPQNNQLRGRQLDTDILLDKTQHTRVTLDGVLATLNSSLKDSPSSSPSAGFFTHAPLHTKSYSDVFPFHYRDQSIGTGIGVNHVLPSGPLGGTSPQSPLGDDDLLQEGPLWRATMETGEKKLLLMKQNLKKALKASERYMEVTKEFLAAGRELSECISAVVPNEPAVTSYYHNFGEALHEAYAQYLQQIELLLMSPLRKFYDEDLKKFEGLKRDFHSEASEYNSFLTKHLSIKSDESAKKRMDSDSKYENKKNQFRLKKFDYMSFLQHFNGGQKEQKIGVVLGNFAEKEFAFYEGIHARLTTDLKPHLDQLSQYQRETYRDISTSVKAYEEKRRILEQRATSSNVVDKIDTAHVQEPSIIDDDILSSPGSALIFKGIRDLTASSADGANLGRRKEGFLYVGTSHNVTSVGAPSINIKTSVSGGAPSNWKKVWCVVSHGQFQELVNWKKQVAPHETINLRFCTVREARNVDRRFCFELVGPHIGRRVYQALDEDDRKSWMAVVQNAIEGLLSGCSSGIDLSLLDHPSQSRSGRMSDSFLGGDRLLEVIKHIDPSNTVCADCGTRPAEWIAINLGCIICIDCSGIHRSLGTHISKIRSLTLDIASFTPELISAIKMIGNTRSNAVWESRGPVPKPSPTATRDQKAQFIRDKYVSKSFLDRSCVAGMDEPGIVKYLSDQLFKAVTMLDFSEVIRFVALGADINFASEARPPLIHISSGYSVVLSPEDSVSGSGSYQPRMMMTELLLQNGANINAPDRTSSCQWYLSRLGVGLSGADEMERTVIVTAGRTVLHYSALLQDLDALTYFLGKGADPTVKDASNMSPLDLIDLGRPYLLRKQGSGFATPTAIETLSSIADPEPRSLDRNSGNTAATTDQGPVIHHHALNSPSTPISTQILTTTHIFSPHGPPQQQSSTSHLLRAHSRSTSASTPALPITNTSTSTSTAMSMQGQQPPSHLQYHNFVQSARAMQTSSSASSPRTPSTLCEDKIREAISKLGLV